MASSTTLRLPSDGPPKAQAAPIPTEPHASEPRGSDARRGMRCVAAGGVLAVLGLGGLASEAPAIVQLVSLCAFLASLLVWDFAFSTLLDDGSR